ncbi:NlpC/P60 family protein [Actinomadura sp. HBU206391]|uniref:C40 family peptidase n=1 Tax=Actinomadura sp. HBU206391 TaxID=2731692 RepID=UPI00164FBDB0|nr:C40 family peptidase [Actinomadura sp. HBU206391]MBC6459277.1 C40 family peptidase [Actinomadura sp. HBU206391]
MDLYDPRKGPLRRAVSPVIPVFAAFCLTAVLPAAALAAAPDPGVEKLQAEADTLNGQLEVLTEQYNGMRVRLDQSKRAARTAKVEAELQQRGLRAMQLRIRRLAAVSYMNGSADESTAAFVGAADPQDLLDRASALRYFAVQDAGRVRDLGIATQAAARAERTEKARAASVEQLAEDIDAKKRSIESLLKTSKARLKAAAKAAKGDKPDGGTGSSPTPTASAPESGESGLASAKALAAVKAARTKLGAPYLFGGGGPKSFDTSGLTKWAYKQAGVNLPHHTGSQWTAGTQVTQSEMLPGDLVFFYADLRHVGIYIGAGEMIHAPETGDVVRIAPIAELPFAGAVRVA